MRLYLVTFYQPPGQVFLSLEGTVSEDRLSMMTVPNFNQGFDDYVLSQVTLALESIQK